MIWNISFWEIGRFENRIALSEKKTPLKIKIWIIPFEKLANLVQKRKNCRLFSISNTSQKVAFSILMNFWILWKTHSENSQLFGPFWTFFLIKPFFPKKLLFKLWCICNYLQCLQFPNILLNFWLLCVQGWVWLFWGRFKNV